MADEQPPPDVAYLCGILAARTAWLDAARERLAAAVAPIGQVGDVQTFDFTTYYDEQMGSGLLRQFVAFAPGPAAKDLARIKRETNRIERELGAALRAADPDAPPRPVNLDPGYVEASKLVLASCKNFSHRIYLSGGVYAEITLQYRGGAWHPLDWTFPDYASGRYFPFLSAVREGLSARRKEART